MKKTLAFMIAFIVAGTICFAQQAAVAPSKPAPVVVKTTLAKNVIGAVKEITAADPAKNTKPGIMVTDEKAVDHAFVIIPTTTIYDADFKATTIDKVKVNDKVKVKFSSKEGVLEATSITVVK